MKAPPWQKAELPLILTAIGLLLYTGLRAAMLSMTHDESSTFLSFIHRPLWTCFSDPACWGTANLHLMNSALMQVSVGLFGEHPFWVRLPNVLAHALYLWVAIQLVRHLVPKPMLRWGAFCLLTLNPYLLEFFSLGRGYGLACAAMMASLYALLRWLQAPNWRDWLALWAWTLFAVLSNFTFLNYLLVLLGFCTLYLLWLHARWDKEALNPRACRAYLGGMGLSVGLLGLMLWRPIQYLLQKGEFEYGSTSLGQSYHALIQDSLQNQGYFSQYTTAVFMGLVGMGLMLAWLGGMRFLTKKNLAADQMLFGAMSLMLGALVLGQWLQFELLGTAYLYKRTALIFYPLGSLLLVLALQNLMQHRYRLGVGLGLGLALFSVFHLIRCANLEQCREWNYDAYSEAVVEYLHAKVPEGQQIHLGLDWLYAHSIRFYQETRKLSFLAPVVYEKDLRTDNFYEYYYVEPKDGPLLHSDYRIEKRFGRVGVLYRRDRP